ncbi:MAG: SDR family oxidoreductase [Coleofasciculus sp. Co-bin14]|nr:SDR family oxidoreductase [Coleofasciculus sp. Co-bin14]
MSVEGKVAIVTGGSSGIGQAACIALANAGFHVVVIGTRRDRINETLNLLDNSISNPLVSPHLGLTLDVTNEDDMQEMVVKTVERFGKVDVLVASAARGKQSGSERLMPYPTASLPLEEWNEVLSVNLTGVFLSNRAVVPVMMQQGAGHIVNICSSTTIHGLRGQAYAPAYCASKFGMVGFTEALAEEVGAYGIRVQALFPGPVKTPLVEKTALVRRFGGRYINTATIAQTIVHLVQQPPDAIMIHPHILPFGS